MATTAMDANPHGTARGGSNSSLSRNSNSRKQQNPQLQLSQIERSVTHLLVATKQLLETLTYWSRGSATEGEVSDVYVRLGYEFNIACRAFNAIGVGTQDLGPVPDLLRTILEDTLSQEASQASLDRFLPRIRDIIINLLQGLKKKQSRLRSGTAATALERQTSNTSPLGREDGAAGEAQSRSSSSRRVVSRDGSVAYVPPRTSSRPEEMTSSASAAPAVAAGVVAGGPESMPNPGRDRYESRSGGVSSNPLQDSSTAQSLPAAVPPYPLEAEQMAILPTPPAHSSQSTFPTPPTPPTPSAPPAKSQDALLALQRGGDLERRASRRFSTYQINKQLGGSISSMMIPPPQTGPAPNRGREVRESIQAVRQRGSLLYNRQKSERRLAGEESPNRILPARISEEGQPHRHPSVPGELLEASVADNFAAGTALPAPAETAQVSHRSSPSRLARRSTASRKQESPTPTAQSVPEDSPQPGRPLTLFLQFKSKIKKIVLEDGSNDLSIAQLQLAFIDKFAWNTHGNGIDLPEIYIQDSISGVRYELEDLNDIKHNSVLVLNYEPLDEVKRHIDDGMTGLRRVVEGIKTSVDNQHSAIARINDRQQETQKELANIAASASINTRTLSSTASSSVPGQIRFSNEQLDEIQILRRNLAILRKSYCAFASDIEAKTAEVKTKSKLVKAAAYQAALPALDGESGRAYVKTTLYGNLSKEQSAIVDRVDEVQDSIEDLRKDVVTRGVRPLPHQLEQVAKDLSNATSDLQRLEAYLEKERPLWSRIWKQELQDVCDDRDAVTETEALISDMKLDLEESEKTFKLVEEACKQQNAMASIQSAATSSLTLNAIPMRSSSGNTRVSHLANSISNADPKDTKHGLLVEVQSLRVDHDSRLEAIERAERARVKELEFRRDNDALRKELGSFVDEGKLKRSGGIEETERIRKAKDEKMRLEFWQRQNDRAVFAEAKPASALERPPQQHDIAT